MIRTMSPDCMEQRFQDAVGIFYVPEWNAFQDENGFLIYSIFEIITPGDLFLFKKNKGYMCVPHRSMPDILVELYYQDDDDNYRY